MTSIIKDSRKRTPEDIERISSLLYQLSINEKELNRLNGIITSVCFDHCVITQKVIAKRSKLN